MIETTVDLGKRAESYVRFANWCNNHKLSPWRTAECIELCRKADLKSNRFRRSEYINRVREWLTQAGMEEIVFYEGWPSFVSPIGEKTCLPMREFI